MSAVTFLNPGDNATGKDDIEIWKIKRMIKSLEMARGNGTSMISLNIPAKDQISRYAKMLSEEYGTAANIKSRVNRLSVLSAITSVQARLKLYSKTPPNGLVVYCGTITTDEGKEKMVNIDFEPFKPIHKSLYFCDNKFHLESLKTLLIDDAQFGFIIMDGNGCLFGRLSGGSREIIHKFSVTLPSKHGRGGQSALRFARLRLESRHNYIRKVAEMAADIFISNDRSNGSGLVLAGIADFKNQLANSDLFDPRLKGVILKIVDTSYGDEQGFNEAIDLSKDALKNLKFVQEKKVIEKLFDEIAQDSGKFVYGLEDTLQALEMGVVETLICWESLEATRLRLLKTSGEQKIVCLRPNQMQDARYLIDPETGTKMEVIESGLLLEWLADNYKSYGTTLEIVTDNTREGAQFVRGFGGIGGLLRYRVDFQSIFDDDEDDLDLSEYGIVDDY